MYIPETLSCSKRKMSFRDTCQIIHGYQCINPEEKRPVIDCRIYTGMRPNCSRIFAAIWICDNKNQKYAHGVGIAGGYGYHKGSEAVKEALAEMGIKLDEDIGGRGYDACVQAFTAIMSALGYSSYVTAEFQP